jgi:hypothetical protein
MPTLRPAKRLPQKVIEQMKKRRLEKLKPKVPIDYQTKVLKVGAEIKALKIIAEYDPISMKGLTVNTLNQIKTNILDLTRKITEEIEILKKAKLERSNLAGLNIEISNFERQKKESEKIIAILESKIKEKTK